MLELLDLLSQMDPSSERRRGEQELLESLNLLHQQPDCNLAMEEEGDKLWQLDCNSAMEKEEEDNFVLLGGRLSPEEAR